ncbi:probable polyketide synthase 1 [Lytechinus variegatus]|uniref:probable polyketide synthase 1 n=1 Tax=Lytechinus variegatus TaxID=7654 RepID=UPI001BB11CE8|nr:probable polyketide synthase 1 [Lytechinus variegatus]
MGSNKTSWGYFPVAVVGIGTRHACGANTTDDFWKVLKEGKECILDIPADRWAIENFHDEDQTRQGKMVTKRCGLIDDMDGFDNLFFKISPREAASLDPQQRHLLEVNYEAFEDAGINPDTLGESCGVFVGIGMMDHAIQLVDTSTTDAYTLTGIAHSVSANRISYAFNLKGPSFAVDTACASGLTALHLACTSLWNRECSIALMSACNGIQLPDITVGFSALGVLSPDGRCSPFSSTANGYVRSEGWGALILKPLSQALADNDHIYTVIRGSAIAANGLANSLTMPSPPAQEFVMKEAYEKFGVSMSDVHYVEAHGTGTMVGDPLEAEAISKAFDRPSDKPLKIGSVKSNFGHTEVAAGVTAAIKVALMMENRAIPPTINFVSPNPHINPEEMRLDIVTEIQPFPTNDKHIIGLNSFGFAGALAHCIFEEPPKRPVKELTSEQVCGWKFGDSDKEGQPIIIPLSAKSPEALTAVAKQWMDVDVDQDAMSVISWMSTRRRLHENRLTVISSSGKQFKTQMKDFVESGGAENATSGTVYSGEPKICMIFPGQGQQYANMGRQLYKTEPVFRNTVNECDAIFKKISGWSVLEEKSLFVERPHSADYKPDTFINDLEVSQPAILFIQLGLFNLWTHWGVKPACVIGHSLGEVSAAYACGGMTLEEAVETIYIRSVEQGKLKGTGSMAALRMTLEEARELCSKHERLYVAAINAPGSMTIAGNTQAIEQIAADNPTIAKQLRVQCAFHTPDMDPTEKTFKEKMEKVVKTPAGVRNIPFYSTLTGARYEGDFKTAYWWDNIRNAVEFQSAVENVLRDLECDMFLECAASATLLSSVNQIAKGSGVKIQLTTIASGQRNQDDRMCALRSLGNMHNNGVPLNWKNITRDTAVYTKLPLYPWQHKPFMLEPEYRRKRRLGLDDRTYKGQNGQLSLETFPFHSDRTAKSKLVFPESGFVEYIMEATSGENELPVVNKVAFTQPLEWPEEKTVTGTKKATLNLDLVRDGNRVEISYKGYVCSTAEVEEGTAQDNTIPVNDIIQRCPKKSSAEDFYGYMQEMGLEYGAKFQVVQDVSLGNGECVGSLESAQDNKQRIQTTHLDACFQLLTYTLGARSSLYQPATIDSIRMNVPSLPAGEPLLAYTSITDCDSWALRGNVMITLTNGKVLAEIKGCTCKNTCGIQTDIDINKCLYRRDFQTVKAHLPPIKEVAKVFEEENLRKLFPDLMESVTRAESVFSNMGAICLAYIKHGLGQVPVKERSDYLDPRYYRRLEKLAKDNSIRQITYDEIPSIKEETLKVAPELKQELTMAQSLGEHLPTTLRNPQSAMTLLFKPECMASYFLDSLTTTFYYKAGAEMVRQAVLKALETKSTVRILEVGARMGGLTHHILEHLEDLCIEGRVEYVFTDLSVAFFPHARDHLAEYPFVKYQQLDIETDIEGQGFVPGSVDILICLDTLHSTGHLQEAIYYMRELICDDGWILLYEATTVKFIAEVIFGALRLCWVFEDDRPECCWMEQNDWKLALEKNGFDDVVALSSPKELFHSVLIGRKAGGDDACINPKAAPVTTRKQWLLVSHPDNAQFVNLVKSSLSGTVTSLSYDEIMEADLGKLKEDGHVIEALFIWNVDHDNGFKVLLHFLQHIGVNVENVCKLWMVTFAATSGPRPINAAGAGLVHAAANACQIPFVTVDIPEEVTNGDKVWASRLVNTMLGNKLSDMELVVKDGMVLTPRLTRMQLPEVKVSETPYWKLTQSDDPFKTESSVEDLGIAYQDGFEVVPGTVLVKVSAASINKRDVDLARGITAQEEGVGAFGMEFCGVVEKVGEGVTTIKPKDEVLGFSTHCLASYTLANADLVVKKPKNLTPSQAATTSIAFATAYYSLVERANITNGESILIQVTEPGLRDAAVQIASNAGAKVICSMEDTSQAASLKKMGAKTVSLSSSSTFVNDVINATDGAGVDVVLNSLQGKQMEKSLELLAAGGRFCSITDSNAINFKLQMRLLQKNRSLISCNIDSMLQHQKSLLQRILRKVTELMGEGKLRPLDVTSRPVTDYPTLFADESITNAGKVAIEIPSAFKPNKVISTTQLFKKNATYIVTAAESGLSQIFARWLYNNGARHIAMCYLTDGGKSKASRTVTYLTGKGAEVFEYCHELHVRGPEGGVAKIFGDLKKRNAPAIRGIFCLGGYRLPGKETMSDITFDSLQTMLSAKVRPAKLSHVMSEKMGLELDYFLTVSNDDVAWGNPSAVASVTGDSYLESFALKRRLEGKPALNVQVGALRGIDAYEFGGQTTLPVKDGEASLHVEEFLVVLGKLLLSPDTPPCVCITHQDWEAVLKFSHDHTLKYRHLAGGEQVAISDCKLSLEDLQKQVKNKLGDLLCVNPDTIDLRQPMINYGVDSLMAVEMVTWASRELSVVISQLDILGGITTGLLLEKAIDNNVCI